MALDQIANFVRGSTDAATDSTQTTISVVDASVFPDPANGDYNLVLWYDNSYPRPDQDPDVEIVRVTARDTTNNDLTVTRGQETTTGASHPSGSALQLSPTAKMFGDIAPADQAVEDFTTNGAAGTAPIAQSDGSLQMGTAGEPNVPNWQEDANSPFTATGAGSITCTLSNAYDVVLVFVKYTNTSGTNGKLALQVNGDTGTNYNHIYTDGAQNNNTTAIDLGITSLNATLNTGPIKMTGRFAGGNFYVAGNILQGRDLLDFAVETGNNLSVTSPLNSITILGETGDFVVEVYGRDI